jgi:sugar phosphate isomerase/epimerase
MKTRRSLLRDSAAVAAGALLSPLAPRQASAIEPIVRAGQPKLRLSLAAYSFREFFKDNRTAKPYTGDKAIDMFDFVDYCADHGCEGTELTSYFFPTDADDAYFLKLRHHAFLRGMPVSGTAVGNNFALPEGDARSKQIAELKAWIDKAAVLGAPHIRVFAGDAGKYDPAEARKLCVAALEECCEYAGTKGIFLGLENHGGIVALPEGLLEIVKAVKSPWFGVNLDTGNFHTADPYADLARCAPYAVNVQVKIEISRPGQKPEPTDMKRIATILREANYQGWVALEFEAAKPWEIVPDSLAKLAEAIG